MSPSIAGRSTIADRPAFGSAEPPQARCRLRPVPPGLVAEVEGRHPPRRRAGGGKAGRDGGQARADADIRDLRVTQAAATSGVRPPAWRDDARRGFLLYVVVSLLTVAAILAFSFGSAKRGAMELLSRNVEQERLLAVAGSAGQEMLALLRAHANQPGSPIGQAFRAIFAEANPLAGGHWVKVIDLGPAQLPHTIAVARQTRSPAEITAEGQVRIVFTGKSATRPVSCFGFVEIRARASRVDMPKEGIEIKDRRELKVLNCQDFLDKYALYVKSYVPDYNDQDRRLTVFGIPSTRAYSWIYLGNRFYPRCLEYPNGEVSLPAGRTVPPVLLDIDLREDRSLLTGFAQGEVGFTLNTPGGASANNPSAGQLFWVLPNRVKFKPFFDQGRYQFADFVPVPQLQEYYRTRIAEVAVNHPSSNDPNSVAFEIKKDYLANRNNYAGAKAYQAVVQTCIDHWEYLFGYTDYTRVSPRVGQLSAFVKAVPFNGIVSYFTEYDKFNPARLLGGRMPRFFGPDRRTAVMIEGPVFLRFFKVAFFDYFSASFNLFGGPVTVDMPPIPLEFVRPDKPGNFQNRDVGKIAGNEKALHSRAVDEFPINRFFFPKETTPRLEPEQYGSKVPGADIFPAVDPKLAAHIYPTGADLLRERVSKDAAGRSVLDVDGLMVVNAGRLQLTPVSLFRGRGFILVLDGDCELGDLRRMDPNSGDTLKIYLSHGNFEVRGTTSPVTIEASLVSTWMRATGGQQGKFYANNKPVQILGNLVLDFLPIGTEGGRGMGPELVIQHDPKQYQPGDPWRVSIGQIRTLYAIRPGERSW